MCLYEKCKMILIVHHMLRSDQMFWCVAGVMDVVLRSGETVVYCRRETDAGTETQTDFPITHTRTHTHVCHGVFLHCCCVQVCLCAVGASLHL